MLDRLASERSWTLKGSTDLLVVNSIELKEKYTYIYEKNQSTIMHSAEVTQHFSFARCVMIYIEILETITYGGSSRQNNLKKMFYFHYRQYSPANECQSGK